MANAKAVTPRKPNAGKGAATRSAAAQSLGPSANRAVRRGVKAGRIGYDRKPVLSIVRDTTGVAPDDSEVSAHPAADAVSETVSEPSETSQETHGETSAAEGAPNPETLGHTEVAEATDARRVPRRFNAHDADTLMRQNNQVLADIEARAERAGMPVPNVALIHSTTQSLVCCQVLIELGLIDEAELGARVMLQMQETLKALLQKYEEAAAKATRPPERGGIAIARR